MRRSLVIGTSLTLVITGIIGQAYSQNSSQDFEALPACRKLDVIASDGKSVTDYILASGFDQFAIGVVNECPQHLENLGQAWDRMVEDPERDMFPRLSMCAQLNAIENTGKSVVEYIVNTGYEPSPTMLRDCPQHLTEFGIAWKRLNSGVIDPPPLTPFEQLPACEQLDVIDSEPNKSVADFIFGSGIDDYETAINTQCNRHQSALEEAKQRVNSRTNPAPRLNAFQVSPDFSSAPSNGLNPEFESLAPCQKLRVIGDSGKSLPQYIADSGPEDFAADIYSMCTRYIDDLIEAERRLGRNF